MKIIPLKIGDVFSSKKLSSIGGMWKRSAFEIVGLEECNGECENCTGLVLLKDVVRGGHTSFCLKGYYDDLVFLNYDRKLKTIFEDILDEI
jgi:hypothetical protein